MTSPDRTFVKRVALRNYKNIARCDVSLGPLVILVGPNGSGKSNFLDALRFVSDSLRTTVYQALHERGGISEVRRRSTGHPNHFGIKLNLQMPSGAACVYAFEIGAKKPGGFEVRRESCHVTLPDGRKHFYQVERGRVSSSIPSPPVASSDRLYLTIASGWPEFRETYDYLSGMTFYSIDPNQLRDLQDADSGEMLLRDGRNAASVLASLEDRNPQIVDRISEYLGHIVPGLKRVSRSSLGHKETLAFQQAVAGGENPWSFTSRSMSDGTLRALGILLSMFQAFDRRELTPISVVGIEEPETALHPGAAELLMDALIEASTFTQVLVTSHSPQLLNAEQLPIGSLLIVDAENGNARIDQADETSLNIMHERLFTAGELLVQGTLKPRADVSLTNGDADEAADAADSQPLFRDLDR